MTRRAIAAVIIDALLHTGCGNPSTTARGEAGEGAADGTAVDCGGSTYDSTTLADAPPVSSLPAGPAGAVDDVGAPAFDPALDWRVVSQSDHRVDLVRELDEPYDHGGGDVRTHESRSLERITGELGDADLALAHTRSPGDTSIDLFVRERACVSGQSAEGRVEVVALVETTEQIQVSIGVRRLPGGQTCPGNPPTPFTLELDEPFGGREIVDVSVVPLRPVAVDTAR